MTKKDKKYYLDLWEKYSIEAQIKLVKNEADAEHFTLIALSLKDSFGEKPQKDIKESDFKDAIERLLRTELIIPDNYRALTMSARSILRSLASDNSSASLTDEKIMDFVFSQFENGTIKPISDRVDSNLVEAYQKNLKETRARNSKIEKDISKLVDEEKDYVTKSQLKKFLSDFRKFRNTGGELALNISRDVYNYLVQNVPDMKSVGLPLDDPFHSKLKDFNNNLQTIRIEEGSSKADMDSSILFVQNGPKSLESATRKAEEIYKGDYNKVRDNARVRHACQTAKIEYFCSHFSRKMGLKNGFELSVDETSLKAHSSGTVLAKDIYKIPVGDAGDFILAEAQYYNYRQHVIESTIPHEIYEIPRRMFDNKRNLSTEHMTWQDARDFYENTYNLLKNIEIDAYPEFKKVRYQCTNQKIDDFFQECLSEIGEKKHFGELVSHINGVLKFNPDLKIDEYPFKKPANAEVEAISSEMKELAKKLDKLHLATQLMQSCVSRPSNQAKFYNAMSKHYLVADGMPEDIVTENKKIRGLIELFNPDNMNKDIQQKAKNDSNKLSAHFNDVSLKMKYTDKQLEK